MAITQKKIFVFSLMLIFLLAGCAKKDNNVPPVCGNETCETGENCPADCSQPSNGNKLEPGNYSFMVQVGNLERKYFVHVPPSNDPKKPMPLVMNFHGGSGSPEGHIALTGMNETADQKGFIAVYPRGTRPDGNPEKILQRFWNIKPGPTGVFNGTDSASAVTRMDEEAFVSAILADMEKKLFIDKKRVYATGFSNGAILSHQLGCDMSGTFAAIATVAGPLWQSTEDCKPARPMPVLHFHGTGDVCAPFNGGASECESGIANEGRIFPSAEETIAKWKTIDRCGETGTVFYQKGEATCKSFSCADESEVAFCRIEGSGHAWPGRKEVSAPGIDVGRTTYDISANETMWEFFQKHSLP